jgi:hypothetical protein
VLVLSLSRAWGERRAHDWVRSRGVDPSLGRADWIARRGPVRPLRSASGAAARTGPRPAPTPTRTAPGRAPWPRFTRPCGAGAGWGCEAGSAATYSPIRSASGCPSSVRNRVDVEAADEGGHLLRRQFPGELHPELRADQDAAVLGAGCGLRLGDSGVPCLLAGLLDGAVRFGTGCLLERGELLGSGLELLDLAVRGLGLALPGLGLMAPVRGLMFGLHVPPWRLLGVAVRADLDLAAFARGGLGRWGFSAAAAGLAVRVERGQPGERGGHRAVGQERAGASGHASDSHVGGEWYSPMSGQGWC